jgi:peptidyl-prolyl cis-trans isomerase C
MKYFFLLLGAALAWGQLQTPPPPADPVVITIGEEKITKSQFEQIISTFPEQQRAQLQTGPARKKLAEQLADLETLAQEGRARKLDQEPKVKADMKLQADRVLAQHTYQELLGSAKPDDADLRAYYAAHKQDWEQVKARHILIRTKGSQAPARPGQKDLTEEEALAKANDLRAKILAGASFADLAKAESDDTGTGANGGELGFFGKGRMVPQFEKAAYAQEVGKVGEPVKSAYGYHIILVEEHTTKPFEEVKNEIEQKIKPEMAQKGLDALKKKTNIVFDDVYFK